MKRYQECNILEKIWRRRHYLALPFLYIYHNHLVAFMVYNDESEDYYIVIGKNLWSLLVGIADCKMNWVYTMEEVKERLIKHRNEKHKI